MEETLIILSSLSAVAVPIVWLVGVAMAFFRSQHAARVMVITICLAMASPLLWWFGNLHARYYGPSQGPEAAGGAMMLGFLLLEGVIFSSLGALAYWFARKRVERPA
jgi:hypothetical protein